nr:MAG TPA: hypothetical protein [Caudoviricetes sp.]
MTAYTSRLFGGIPQPVPRRPGLALSDDLLRTLRPSSEAPAAVRRRPGPDRYRFASLSLYGLYPALGPPSPSQVRSGSDAGPRRSGFQGSPRFLRVLPGSSPHVPVGM